ncbi:ComEC/Rec2 family competence protein [Clostridium ganghwense]|uniref:ComEC/Rec2 family competence protein n=1 Tax=Clostridium ganghwense TaxID=312089 RepID=A0ABT4CSA1_9CLOT|nr:ComEC/Rec2 family competence protein [Clostridium ganghwense]MCY6371948.1 ComEC/Rec2 family competence protein [Clostridium ganghwense]
MDSFKRFLCILAISVLCIFLFTGCISSKSTSIITSSKDKMLVHYIDVGQGDSILIQVNNKNLLIDAGSKSSTVTSYLKKFGIKTLDYVIVTHPHDDHIGGMSSVISNFNIGHFYAPKKITNTNSFKNMVVSLNKIKLQITPAKAGEKLDMGKNIKCIIVAPNNDSYKETNNYSVVLRVSYINTNFLFTGDAETLSEEEILKKGYNIKADVLKLGHHGSNTSTSINFLNEVNPKVAVISCGKGNDYGHPHKETLTKLKDKNVILYRTDLDGTIILESDGNKITKR